MLIDAVATHAQARPDALACVDLETERRWNYRALNEAINQVANWLVYELGAASGARVATVTRNCAEMLILNLACVRAGAIFVPFNWRLSIPEIGVLMEDATPAIVLRDAEFDFSEQAFYQSSSTYVLAELLDRVADFPIQAPVDARRDFDLPSTLLYTSGTSGKPKGVMVSETNAFWSQCNFNLGNSVWPHSVFLCDMPLFHTAGLLANTRAPILAGGAVLISGGFDVEKTLRRLSDPNLGITHYFSVPQMAQMLWNHPEFEPQKLQQLEVYATGGAPNPKAQIERFIGAGIPMSDGFGMSETGSVTGMPLTNRDVVVEKAGACGLPYISMQLCVVDEQGQPQPSGVPGELWIRGPGVTKGYWQQPELTAATFTGSGWFKTGDVAICDQEGFYFLVDRKKDMYISGGENVYPAEVEACIIELPKIAEAAVVGVADEKWGEVGIAVVIPVPGQEVHPEEVLQHCLKTLAKYKVPKKVVISDSIPRTSSGKVQKRLLSEQFLKYL